MTGPACFRRVAPAAAMVVVSLATSVVWAASGAAPVGAQTCGPAPQGRAAVAVVVDTGSGAPVVRCAVVPGGATGADVLAAALGPAAIRVGDGSGGKSAAFVCGLLGVPAAGCTNTANEPTWNYWHASPGGTWRYSSTGFTSYVVPGRCSVEGWSYAPASTKPRVAPPAVQCEASPVTSGTAPPTGPGGAVAPIGGPAPTGVVPGAAAPPPVAVAGATATAPSVGRGAGPVATSSPLTGTAADAASPGTTPSGDTAGSAGPVAASNGAASNGAAVGADRGPGRDERATAGFAPGRQPDGSGPGIGVLLGAVAAAALVVVAVVRSRRGRSPGEPVV